MLHIKINWQSELLNCHSMAPAYRYEVGTQSANRVLGYIRRQLTGSGAKGKDPHLLVALDQPVGYLVRHKDIAPRRSTARHVRISRPQQLHDEYLRERQGKKLILY